MDILRKATEEDIPAVAEIFEHVIDREETVKVNVGWKRGVYPTEDTAREALAAGDLYVLEDDGRIVATGRINQAQVPEYALAGWTTDNPDDKVMVLHTLAVEPSASGHGYGTKFVAFYEKHAKETGCAALRMDTNEINKPARALYARLGYREVGIVPCSFNGIPGVQLVCLEKIIG